LIRVGIGNRVPSIGTDAFNGCWSLASITMGTNVSDIGDRAFGGCIGLTNLVIPDGVTNLGTSAFEYCSSLTNVTIPRSVMSIGDAPFSYCSSLAAINVSALNPAYTSVDGVLFTKNLTTLLQCPCTQAGGYTIPTGVTRIGTNAFAICNNLTRITIPDSVTTIGDYAFFGLANLTNVIVGNRVVSIGVEAFEACSALDTIYFRGDAPSIGSAAFNFDNHAKVYYLPGTVGWETFFGGRPTLSWLLPHALILNQGPSFGMRSNGFGFTISWATNIPVVVEACTNLAAQDWSPVVTNALTGGTAYFSDPDWTLHPIRIYRVRSQ
jgi:hypothetical protein